jgi:peptidyl-prolyl cis-trans isomerase D
MLSSFRRLSKSTVGTIIMVAFLLLILASFALGDIANLQSGNLGMSSSTLVKVGGEEITDRQMSQELEQRLAQVRQQNPAADYSALAEDFDPLLASLIDQAALSAFADKYDFNLSKKVVDAQIASIPGAKGLDGKFSDSAYRQWLAQQRLTDGQVRHLIRAGLLQQMLLEPLAAGARLPVGVATPYASMLLEARQGEIAIVPIAAFRSGLNPTAADLQGFYTSNRARYMVPEQRSLRIARIGQEQVANVTPADQEIAGYYNAHQDVYGPSETRVLSQAVVADQKTAQEIAARARAGGSFAAAAAPAGFSAADVSVGPQKQQEFAGLTDGKVAASVFAARSGDVVGPLHSSFGWHVVKVESINRDPGKSLASVRGEIVTKLSVDKRKEALESLVEKVQTALDDGSSFEEAAAAAKLSITQTPLLLANGTSRQDPGFKLPPELIPALKSGFELEANEDPTIEALPDDAGYAMVAPAQVISAAPAPLAQVKDKVANDWIDQKASAKARAVASAIAAKATKGMPLAQAVAQAGTALPAPRPIAARRIDISNSQQPAPEPVRMLFNLGEGKSRLVADPQDNGFAIVKVNKIVPGDARSQMGLVARVQQDFGQALPQEYVQQFVNAVRGKLGVKRNEGAIAATRKRIIGS